MMSAYPTPDGPGLERLVRELGELRTQLRDLQRPSGTNIGNTEAQVQALVAKVEARLITIDADVQASIAANSMTTAAIQSLVAAPPSVAATGPVSGTTGTFNSGLYSTDARNFVVVTNYAASWIDVNGHFGISPSTERYKKDIVAWIEKDPEAVFGIVPSKYRLRIPDRWMPIVDQDGKKVVDPDTGVQELRLIEGFEDAPDAKERIGFIAERLVEAGFEEAVVFDEDGLPVSINYAEWVVPLQMGMRWLHTEWAKQKGQIEDLTRRLDAAGL